MKLRLAGGVVASGLGAWVPRPAGPARLSGESDAHPGAAVALGPAEASPEQVERAVKELVRLVKAGDVAAAGAGVDLGAGFRSARLAGARGDQRDAVLAALKVLGIEGADRLGDRAGFLVALFGPAVTKRVGAAAAKAIGEGRWAAVHLASATSDVLGPEQLEQVLTLRAPDGADLISGGLPSTLAGHLGQVLEPVPRTRRLELITDLWARVCEHHEDLARRERLLATHGAGPGARQDRMPDLRRRRREFEDERLLAQLKSDLFDADPSLADAARWIAPDHFWSAVLTRILHDALAATALLRTAVAVSDHGMAEGLARSQPLLSATVAKLGEVPRLPKQPGLPARPGTYVQDLHRKLLDPPTDAKLAAYVRQRLARARDYAVVAVAAFGEVFDGGLQVPERVLAEWGARDLRRWRAQVGYTSVRPAAEWREVSLWARRMLGYEEALADRLAAVEGPVAAEVETLGDLLWAAELYDALAQLSGHDAAAAAPLAAPLWLDHDPPAPEPEPLRPRLDSITLAVSGAAQLVALGGVPARGVKTWAAFVGGLRASIKIAEALSGEFAVPAPLAAVDGTVVPGTGMRFRLARSARTLAEWSDYMGNCIASPYYIESATKGQSALAALCDKDGRVVANVELKPGKPAARGWRINEIEGRFNRSPDQALEKRFRSWVDALPGPARAGEPVPEEIWPDHAGTRRRTSSRLLQDAAPALAQLTEQVWASQVTGETMNTLAALADTTPDAALTRLRRLRPGSLADACRTALGEGTIELVGLWNATGVRPLETAVAALDPALRDRFERLALLLEDTPLPGSLRRLVKRPAIAPAYSLNLVACRVRAAIGRLAFDDDPIIARAVTRRTTESLLCALTVAVTCRTPPIARTPVSPPRAVTVPGFPVTRLNDAAGPWQRALPAAREMGADTGLLWDQVAGHGLQIPASWLGPGGWPALWSRAH